MTPDQARALCDELQERVTQMGDRTGEGLHLGRCLSTIRSFAAMLDDPAALTARIAEIAATREAERVAAEEAAAAAAEVDDARDVPPDAPAKKTRKKKAAGDATPPAPRLDE